MTVINTNVKALFTQAAMKLNERSTMKAMNELSTGKRINSAKDDAAGLAIAARMTQQIQGLNQGIRNAGDAIAMIQTTEGATENVTTMLLRCSELAMQAAVLRVERNLPDTSLLDLAGNTSAPAELV